MNEKIVRLNKILSDLIVLNFTVSNKFVTNEGCVLCPFQRIVWLFRDSNLQRDEMKDDSPFGHTVH